MDNGGKLNWMVYALIAFLAWGASNLGFKYISGKDELVMSFFIYASATAMLAGYIAFTFSQRNVSMGKFAIIAALMGIVSIIGTIAIMKGVEVAPNPGYVLAISSSSVIIVTLLSPLLYESELSPLNLIGVIVVIFGIALLVV